jgi:hypothetical protein
MNYSQPVLTVLKDLEMSIRRTNESFKFSPINPCHNRNSSLVPPLYEALSSKWTSVKLDLKVHTKHRTNLILVRIGPVIIILPLV